MFRYLCLALCLVAVMVICLGAPIGETENVDEVENLKSQVSKLSAEVEQLKVHIKDLYFMTEPLRVRVLDSEEGMFYYAKAYRGRWKGWGMLPSELSKAELYYLLRSAGDLGYSKEKTEALGDQLIEMPKNPYLMPYEMEYNFGEGELTYHPDLKAYVTADFFK